MNHAQKRLDQVTVTSILEAQQSKKYEEARALCLQLLEDNPDNPDVCYLYGVLQHQCQQTPDGIRFIEKAMRLQRSAVYAKSLGEIFYSQMHYDKALQHFEAWAVDTLDSVAPHLAIARTSALAGKIPKFWQWMQAGLQRDATNAALWECLGLQHLISGNWAQAEVCWRVVLGANPNHPVALMIINGAQQFLGKAQDLQPLDPYSVDLTFLALPVKAGKKSSLTLNAQTWLAIIAENYARAGQLQASIRFIQLLVRAYPQQEIFWMVYSGLFGYKGDFVVDETLRRDVVTLLNKPRMHFFLLQNAAVSFIQHDHHMKALCSNAAALTLADMAYLGCNKVLTTLMTKVPLANRELEELLTRAREVLLREWYKDGAKAFTAEIREFLAALAEQCFQNEYVYSVSDGEATILPRLQAECQDISMFSSAQRVALLLLGCYQPLHRHPCAAMWKELAKAEKPSAFKDVIQQQIIEPFVENSLKQGIPAIVAITEGVSKKVQAQYEDNPYPRWRELGKQIPVPFMAYLQNHFPKSHIAPPSWSTPLRFLNAGCGTGQHALQSASLYQDSQITAVDLSRASLAYAKRKAEEYGIKNVHFYHGDILSLGALDQKFHVIESAGVLHHMHDPMQGWRVLRDLLMPKGFMFIGLYSTFARQAIHALRADIDTTALQDPPSIRALRLQCLPKIDGTWVASSSDYYSLSGVRDLLFHVQEHTFTLPQIEEAIQALGLRLLGFNFINLQPVEEYKRAYPNDPAATNLKQWAEFEENHPETFRNMYQFWLQAID